MTDFVEGTIILQHLPHTFILTLESNNETIFLISKVVRKLYTIFQRMAVRHILWNSFEIWFNYMMLIYDIVDKIVEWVLKKIMMLLEKDKKL